MYKTNISVCVRAWMDGWMDGWMHVICTSYGVHMSHIYICNPPRPKASGVLMVNTNQPST